MPKYLPEETQVRWFPSDLDSESPKLAYVKEYSSYISFENIFIQSSEKHILLLIISSMWVYMEKMNEYERTTVNW